LLPAVLRDWRGFIFSGKLRAVPVADGAKRLTACVVIDYQNIHLTARDAFAPRGTPPEDCLVHPALFAERVLAVRELYLPTAEQGITDLRTVRVFRGAPSNAKQPDLYRVTERQRAEWTRDRRVIVHYRPIKYPPQWPAKPAREKGVDVLVALAYVRDCIDATHDVVILASHDTDMEPALEMAMADSDVSAETAGWRGERVLRCGPAKVRHTALNGAEFVRSRDRRDYWPEKSAGRSPK
jgi:hypothetical protein